jgi:23S rRNA pseudouridine2605 synthase
MFASIGHPALALKRVRLGNLDLGKLKEGEIRELSPKEIKALLK